jgi:hypothetical protein
MSLRELEAAVREGERLRAERDFLLARIVARDSTWVGVSSNAMVAQAMTGAQEPSAWPYDEADLGRCVETFHRAPEHLREAMLPTLRRFQEHVAQRYPA